MVTETVNLTNLRQLPEGTFGRAYAAFMDVHGLDFCFFFSSDLFFPRGHFGVPMLRSWTCMASIFLFFSAIFFCTASVDGCAWPRFSKVPYLYIYIYIKYIHKYVY